MPTILTLDLGTTYFKACLFDRDGRLLDVQRAAPPIVHPQPNHWELPVDGFKATVRDLIRKLGAGGRLADVAAISFATQTNSFCLLDQAGEPLTPLILWVDERAQALDGRVRDLSAGPEFLRETGVPGLMYQFSPAKLLHLREQAPERWRAVRRFCLISDLLTLWLTGQHVTEAGAAGLTGMLNVHDLSWRESLLKAVGLAPLPNQSQTSGTGPSDSPMPRVVRAGTDVGPLLGPVAAELGLPAGCRFVVGCLDQYAGAIGAGNIRPGLVSETTGTVLATVRCTHGFEASPPSDVFQGPAFDQGLYFQMAFGSVSANLLEWYHNQLPDRPGFEQLDQLAAGVPAGAQGLRIKPGAEKGALRDGFNHWTPSTPPGQAARAILEGVAVALRNQVRTLAGGKSDVASLLPPGQPIRNSGGAARSELWLQIKADVLGVPTESQVCPEPTSLGAAMLAGRAVRWGSLDDLAAGWIRVRSRHEPTASAVREYARLFPTNS